MTTQSDSAKLLNVGLGELNWLLHMMQGYKDDCAATICEKIRNWIERASEEGKPVAPENWLSKASCNQTRIPADSVNQLPEPVAFSISWPSGEVDVLGWLPMKLFAAAQQMMTLREGCYFAFAYQDACLHPPASEPSFAALKQAVDEAFTHHTSLRDDLAKRGKANYHHHKAITDVLQWIADRARELGAVTSEPSVDERAKVTDEMVQRADEAYTQACAIADEMGYSGADMIRIAIEAALALPAGSNR